MQLLKTASAPVDLSSHNRLSDLLLGQQNFVRISQLQTETRTDTNKPLLTKMTTLASVESDTETTTPIDVSMYRRGGLEVPLSVPYQKTASCNLILESSLEEYLWLSVTPTDREITDARSKDVPAFISWKMLLVDRAEWLNEPRMMFAVVKIIAGGHIMVLNEDPNEVLESEPEDLNEDPNEDLESEPKDLNEVSESEPEDPMTMMCDYEKEQISRSQPNQTLVRAMSVH